MNEFHIGDIIRVESTDEPYWCYCIIHIYPSGLVKMNCLNNSLIDYTLLKHIIRYDYTVQKDS
jgi:hypothetical protein